MEYQLPPEESVRLRGFLIPPPGHSSGDVAVRLTLVDQYGNTVTCQDVRLNLHADNHVQLPVLGTARSIRGRIIDRDGNPIATAVAVLGTRLLQEQEAKVDGQGCFVFHDFWGERPQVRVAAAGCALSSVIGDGGSGAVYVMDPAKTLMIETLDA